MKIYTLQGLKRVTFAFRTTTGPRMIEAGVTIDYDPARELILESAADWPPGEDYTEAVFNEIRRSVASLTGKRFGGRFTRALHRTQTRNRLAITHGNFGRGS